MPLSANNIFYLCRYVYLCFYRKQVQLKAMQKHEATSQTGLPTKFYRIGGVFGKYRVFRKNCVFSQFTATPPSPTSLLDTFKALNAEQVYSHSYWLEIFCTTNSSRVLARERRQTFENSWKKTQYLMNTLYYQAWGNAWPARLLCCVSDFRIREGQEGRVGVGRNQLWRHSASKDSRSTWYDKYSVQTMDIGEDYFPENKKEVKNVHRSIRHSVNAI